MSEGAPDKRVDMARALRDAGITALLAFGLFLPLIGFQTITDIRNNLILTTRWPLLFAIVAVVGTGRLVYSLVLEPWLQQRTIRRVAAAPSPWRAVLRQMVHALRDRLRHRLSGHSSSRSTDLAAR